MEKKALFDRAEIERIMTSAKTKRVKYLSHQLASFVRMLRLNKLRVPAPIALLQTGQAGDGPPDDHASHTAMASPVGSSFKVRAH
jgi:hypothetical protein